MSPLPVDGGVSVRNPTYNVLMKGNLFRHVRSVCGNLSLVRVAPGTNVFGDEAVSGLMALSPRRDGTMTRALEPFFSARCFALWKADWDCPQWGDPK